MDILKRFDLCILQEALHLTLVTPRGLSHVGRLTLSSYISYYNLCKPHWTGESEVSNYKKKTCLSLHISNILQPCISKNHSMNWMSLPTKIISKSWWQLVIGFLISLSQPSGRLILPSSWLSLPHMLAILGFVKDHLQSHHPLGLEDAFLFGKASYEVLMLVFGSVVVRGRGIYWCCCLSQKNIMPQMM